MEGTSSHWIEGEVELIVPPELETSLTEGIITVLGTRVSLGQVSNVSGNLVGNDSGLDIVTVWQTKVLLGSHVAKHGSTESGNVGSTNGGSDVVVARSNIRSEWSKSVERSLMTPIELVAHVLWNLVQRDMARSFVHDLDVLGPRACGQETLSHEFGKLCFVVGIEDGARTEAVTNGQRNVVFSTDIQNIVPMFVGEVLLVVVDVPLGMDGSTTRDDTSLAMDRHGDISQQDTGMDGEVVNTLLGLLNQGFPEDFPREVFGNTIHLFKCLINRDSSDWNGRVAHDPFTSLANVHTSTQIHEGVSTPEHRPL